MTLDRPDVWGDFPESVPRLERGAGIRVGGEFRARSGMPARVSVPTPETRDSRATTRALRFPGEMVFHAAVE